MSPSEFVHSQVYNGAIKAGASERKARASADDALIAYGRGVFKGRVSGLIKEYIVAAKKSKS